MVYVAPVHPWCVCVLQVLLAEFMMPIGVLDWAVSLLEMIEEPPFELVPPLEVAQVVNTWVVVSGFFRGCRWCRL